MFFTLVFLACFLAGNGQEGDRDLAFYMETARRHSPLLQDYRNRESMQRLERERLKSLYTRSRLELNGEYLFVPVISKDGGRTSFQWNAQDGTDYYGYDLGESSGHLHAGFTWTQPLLGRGSYRAAEEQVRVQTAILSDDIRLEEHQLERAVAEQYLLCLLDKSQMDFADSIGKVLERQESLVRELARNGMAAQSDLHLLAIERAVNRDLQITARQSYRSHLSDLNLLCGIADTATVELAAVELRPGLAEGPSSLFLEQYRLDSLSVVADLNFFKAQYKPQLNLFVDGGLRVSEYARVCRHFGWSAGLTFSWTIFDGRQKRWQERQSQVRLNTIAVYKAYAQTQREGRRGQCLTEMRAYDERLEALRGQLGEYDAVLADYMKEIQAGQRSVVDYVTVLRSKIQAERDYMTVRTNRQLLIAAYNYWNW